MGRATLEFAAAVSKGLLGMAAIFSNSLASSSAEAWRAAGLGFVARWMVVRSCGWIV